MIGAVVDTSTIISAVGWEGKPQQIVDKCLDKEFKLVTSPEILEEVRGVLFRPKFDFIDADRKNEFLLLLSQLAEIVIPKHKVEICRDKDDNKFIELALTARVKIIVSSDEDLLILKEYKDIKILSPSEFLEFLKEKKVRLE